MNNLVSLPRVALGLVFGVACGATLAATPEEKIASAMSAAPPSVSATATIMDWPAEEGADMTELRKGDNGWTCLPDMPATTGNDPMCLDAAWLDWAHAWMNKQPLTNKGMGFGYMLQGGTPESNTDPYATEPTASNEWISEPVPHLMILVPDNAMLEGLPTDHTNGGPWVMWQGTPYVHIMAPMPAYQP
ncbi:hypothetical protein [uncultured Oceanisphaera sp.]|uniref:hypothetical protein n=1 Tax=uncultured Oceanisphaera sp. TaxID=353858 RepID=UPI002602B4FB|nr:hypothetical protein [uncultured Oceanisphaera sp.]